jgi:hypothetical protein
MSTRENAETAQPRIRKQAASAPAVTLRETSANLVLPYDPVFALWVGHIFGPFHGSR